MPRNNVRYVYPEEEAKRGSEFGFRHWLQGTQERAASELQTQKAGEATTLQELLIRRKREEDEREAAEAGPAVEGFLPPEAKERMGLTTTTMPTPERAETELPTMTTKPLRLTPGSLGVLKTVLPKLIEGTQTDKWQLSGHTMFNPKTGETRNIPPQGMDPELLKYLQGSGGGDPFQSQPEITYGPSGTSFKFEQVGRPEDRVMMDQARKAYPNDPAAAKADFLERKSKYEERISGAKTRGALPEKALDAEARKELDVYTEPITVIWDLDRFSPAEIKAFAGMWGKGASEFKSIVAAGKQWMTGQEPNQTVKRYLEFKNLAKRLQATAFLRGGKQLTPFEASVVFGFTPTGEEYAGPAEFMAKVRNMQRFLPIIQEMHLWAATAPRREVMTQYNTRLRLLLDKAGVPVPKKALEKFDTQDFNWGILPSAAAAGAR